MQTTTAFGSSLISPSTSAAILRAHASKYGIELKKASLIDLVSATISAELWCYLTNTTSFSAINTKSAKTKQIFSRILARAAGIDLSVEYDLDLTTPANALPLLDQYIEWALQFLTEEELLSALQKTATDLSCGSVPEFDSMASLVALHAEA